MKQITFGQYKSYDDLHLILTSKTIGSPVPKIFTVDVEGADGVLDYTEYFGGTKYSNVTLTFEFSTVVVQSQFLTLFSAIKAALHGKKMQIVLDDDSSYYYIGRITVSEFTNEKSIGNISITCDCEPYKLKKYKTLKKVNLATNENVVVWNQINSNINNSSSRNGITFTNNNNGTWTVKGFATGTAFANIRYASGTFFLVEGHKYYLNSGNELVNLYLYRDSTRLGDATFEQIIEAPAQGTQYDLLRLAVPSNISSINVNVKPIAIDLTLLYGAGNEPESLDDSRIAQIKQLAERNLAYTEGIRATILDNDVMKVVPTITTSASATIGFKGITSTISAGESIIPELELEHGCNLVKFPNASDSAEIVFDYQEGGL